MRITLCMPMNQLPELCNNFFWQFYGKFVSEVKLQKSFLNLHYNNKIMGVICDKLFWKHPFEHCLDIRSKVERHTKTLIANLLGFDWSVLFISAMIKRTFSLFFFLHALFWEKIFQSITFSYNEISWKITRNLSQVHNNSIFIT